MENTRQELADAEARFDAVGGRDPDLAEQIDALRLLVAAGDEVAGDA